MYTLTKGGKQELTFISEPNLYRVIFRSNKAEAVKFQDWIFEEVIPQIRKTGGYQASPAPSVIDHMPTRDELIQVIYMLGDRLKEIHGWGGGNLEEHISGKFNKSPNEATYGELVLIVRWLHKQTQTVAGRPIVAGVNCPVKPFGVGAALPHQAESLPAMLAAAEQKPLPKPAAVAKPAPVSDTRRRELAETHNSFIAKVLMCPEQVGSADGSAALEILNLSKIINTAHENFTFSNENQNLTAEDFRYATFTLTRLQNTVMDLLCC